MEVIKNKYDKSLIKLLKNNLSAQEKQFYMHFANLMLYKN